MLPVKRRDNHFLYWAFILLILFMVLLPVTGAFAQDAQDTLTKDSPTQNQQAGAQAPTSPIPSNVTAQSMLTNIAKQIPQLTSLVTAFGFVFGIYLVIAGVFQLKHIGEMRTMASHEHHLTKPIALILMGAALLYIPSAVQVGLHTFWSDPNPYGYVTADQSQWSEAIRDCFVVVQFVGVIAFIRGLIIFSHLGSSQHQQGGFAKGLTFITAGIFCINIYGFVKVILATLGLPDNF